MAEYRSLLIAEDMRAAEYKLKEKLSRTRTSSSARPRLLAELQKAAKRREIANAWEATEIYIRHEGGSEEDLAALEAEAKRQLDAV